MNYLSKLLISILLTTACFFYPLPSKADPIESTSDRVTVVPAKFEISGEPGESSIQALRITNEDSEPALLAIAVDSFRVSPEDGVAVLDHKYQNHDDLSKWIMFDESGMQFEPNETKVISYKIDVPKSAKPGGHYASIILSMDRIDQSNSQPSATAKVVSLVMLTVSGDIEDDAKAQSLQVLPYPNAEDVDFVLRVQNFGNNHIKPKGSIVITNLWGAKIDEIPLDEENVLPGMTKKITTSWNPSRYLIGRYTATVVADYGINYNNSLNSVATFWVLPWPVILSLLVFVVLIIVGVKIIKNRKK